MTRSRGHQAGRATWLSWRSLAWLLVGLVLVVLLCKWQLDYNDKLAPLVRTGALKQRIAARNFAVTVDGFRLAQSYTVANSEAIHGPDAITLRTPGVWMSVVARVEALRDAGYVSARLHTRDGFYYTANDDKRPRANGVNLSGASLATALPQTGAYFFELPPSQVPGAHIQFYWGLLTPEGMDSLLDVDLDTGRMTLQDVHAKTAANIDLRP